MSVELRHLRALVALADADTFTTAAAELGTSQPTLSRTIQQLESYVGTRLVHRTTREVALTSRGETFAHTARELLSSLEQTIDQLRADTDPPLRLGWAWAGFGQHTLPLITSWKREHGRALELARPADPLAALRRDRIDAALIRQRVSGGTAPDDLTVVTLFTERLVAAVARADPRAHRPAVTLSDLSEDSIAVCRTAATATAELWAERCAKTQATPRTITVSGTDEWLTKIAVGDAVGVTSAATAYSHPSPEVVYLPITDAPAVEVALAFPARRQHSRVAAFAAFARDYFQRGAAASG